MPCESRHFIQFLYLHFIIKARNFVAMHLSTQTHVGFIIQFANAQNQHIVSFEPVYTCMSTAHRVYETHNVTRQNDEICI